MLCSQIVLKTSPKASNNSYATTIKLNHTLSAKTKSFSLIKIVKKIFKYLHFSKINIQLTYKMTIFFLIAIQSNLVISNTDKSFPSITHNKNLSCLL